MIHNPEVCITCDNDFCGEPLYIPMAYTSHGYQLSNGRAEEYACIEGWVVMNGNHYCPSCAKRMKLSKEDMFNWIKGLRK